MKKFIAVGLILVLCGCSMTQLRQEAFGLSISDVKNSKTKQTEQYDVPGDECVKMIKDTLNELGGIIHENKRNKFIVADNLQSHFRSCIDTTQVGIVVTPWETNKSQVDVASGNADLAAFVSNKISEKIRPEKKAGPKEEREVIN